MICGKMLIGQPLQEINSFDLVAACWVQFRQTLPINPIWQYANHNIINQLKQTSHFDSEKWQNVQNNIVYQLKEFTYFDLE